MNGEPVEVENGPDLTSEELEDLSARFSYRVRRRDVDSLARSLGVSANSLWALSIGWNKEKKCFTFPMYDEREDVVGIQFRGSGGRKWSLTGGRLGLFIPWTVAVDFDCSRPLFLTEGLSDCAAIYSLGFDAVGRPCRNFGDRIFQRWLAHWGKREVVVVADNDSDGGGLESARRAARSLGAKILVPRLAKDARSAIIASGGGARFDAAVCSGSNDSWEMIWPE